MLDTDRETRAFAVQTLGFIIRTAESLEPALRSMAADSTDAVVTANLVAALAAVRKTIATAAAAHCHIAAFDAAVIDAG